MGSEPSGPDLTQDVYMPYYSTELDTWHFSFLEMQTLGNSGDGSSDWFPVPIWDSILAPCFNLTQLQTSKCLQENQQVGDPLFSLSASKMDTLKKKGFCVT